MSDENRSKADILRAISDDQDLLRVAHRKIEEALVEFRDRRISAPGRGNGLVIREADGQESSTIRMSVQDAVRMALTAIADELAAEDTTETGGTR